jgi:hypothetical protein
MGSFLHGSDRLPNLPMEGPEALKVVTTSASHQIKTRKSDLSGRTCSTTGTKRFSVLPAILAVGGAPHDYALRQVSALLRRPVHRTADSDSRDSNQCESTGPPACEGAPLPCSEPMSAGNLLALRHFHGGPSDAPQSH